MIGRTLAATLTVAVILMLPALPLEAQDASAPAGIEAAQRTYYNANYLEAADQALALRVANPDDFAARELRTAAILFQIKRLIGEDAPDRERALAGCATCPELIATFREEIEAGRNSARRKLDTAPGDLEALFYLGKLDLNYVWLHLGPLNRRTGWTEYREARKSLDGVLKVQPAHVRARVARAWIEYIVDTKVMFGFRWVLGGGDRKKALAAVRDAAASRAPFFDLVEARFALWEMLAREKQLPEAVDVARSLLGDFPQNKELAKFIEKHATVP